MEMKVEQNVKNTNVKEMVTFIENRVPALEAGEYSIKVTQETEGKGDGGEVNDKISIEKKLFVTGERFNLNPDTIYSMFPYINYQGSMENVLPHIVFASKTLPWNRTLIPGDRKIPWTCLLLFNEEEILNKDVMEEAKKIKEISADPNVFVSPNIMKELEEGEEKEDVCKIIDVKTDLLKQIMPCLEDLKYLAHVREVEMLKKEASPKLKNPLDMNVFRYPLPATEQFSVVICNRFPKMGKNKVYLVSLDGFGEYIKNGMNNIDKEKVRLVSLKDWEFEITTGKKSLCSIAPELNNSYKEPVTLKAVAKEDSDEEVKKAMELGYVPMKHITRLGDETVSWYRGPFVPYKTDETISVSLPISSQDKLYKYNPETGIFDVSYAVAWQMGRLLAIQNKKFALMLYKWKKDNDKKFIKELEEEILKDVLQQQSTVSSNKLNISSGEKFSINMLTKILKNSFEKMEVK